MPKAAAATRRAWLVRAINIVGEVYGTMRTVMSLATLLGEDYKEEELDIIANCEDINSRVLRILDRLEEIDRELTLED